MSKNKLKIRITVIILLVGVIVFMFIYPRFFQKQENNSVAEIPKSKISATGGRKLNVNAQVIKYETISENIRTKGVLIPDEEVELSFESSGKITEIYFKEGTSVQKGDLLAKINDLPLQAELKKLMAQVQLLEDRVFRQRSLLEKDAVSKEAFDQATTELEKLNADIKLVQAKIKETELRAPFNGIIGLRLVSEGTYATPSTKIAKLTKIIPLKIEFSVNEKQSDNVKSGTQLSFTLDNDLNRYPATVYAVESSLDAETMSLKVRALYNNEGGRVKPGRSATIEIKLKEINNAIVVPSHSVIAEMGRDIAFVYRNGKAKEVVLHKGLRDAASLQITNGLNLGDTLITTGVMQLRNGMDVIIDNLSEK